MADKRMLSKKITDHDNFTSLSSSAQALYMHLCLSADDDGFCNQVSLAMFKAHAGTQDLEALIDRHYLMRFESGVILVKHWRMMNALRKDRYTPTAYQEEAAQISIKSNGSYTWLPDGCQDGNQRLPVGCPSIGKVSIGKNSIGKNSIGKNSIGKNSIDKNSIDKNSIDKNREGNGSSYDNDEEIPGTEGF